MQDRLGGFLVPQEVYHTRQNFEPLPAIEFGSNGQLGICLQDALDDRLADLDSGDVVPPIARSAGKVSLRVKVSKTGHLCTRY